MADDRFYVKTLRMQNFRCFEDVKLQSFDPHFNLLVGENGAGKSSVLLALAQLLTDIPATFGKLSPPSLIRGADMAGIRESRPFGQTAGTTIIVSATYRWLEEERGLEATVAANDFVNLQATNHAGEGRLLSFFADRAIPILVRFTASRPFRRTIPASGDPAPSREPQRSESFLGWNDAGASSDELLRWARDETLIDFERTRGASWKGVTAMSLVNEACIAAIEEARDFFYNGTRRDIVVTFNDGRNLQFSNMSDGQRALVGLVAEIARRMYVLNGNILGSKCFEETPGVILIDEIDLHLHPKWQREIVPALKRVFPKIQFFATTHSPQVIGEARPEEVVLLTRQGQSRPVGSYGMDSNWILECVMEAEGRNPKIGRRIKALFDLIEEDRLVEAKAEIQRLRQELPDVAPEIASAETYIWNLEHGPDEAAE